MVNVPSPKLHLLYLLKMPQYRAQLRQHMSQAVRHNLSQRLRK